ncbi:P-loop NTPase fold protein [Lysinibacillus capsici]|uniref:KAP family P-loop NTPase fold protein n=1 Tax=Lysinibacillus capsici TaxID=2115968 RepID=UPI00029C9DD8|nr:P-loop NTPase fold protein [Lysinibacillus capsici]EKU41282.1 KAP P-loop domain-containing protein [Lysinibacillus fusiformis ZB2]MED4698448.1 P-loop NTPase fold protein [Lysinibacillus capsici]
MQEFTYSSDAPIVDASQDVFNRFPFAQRIAKVISNRQDASSIVIGIYGAWGEGKTSVFNFIESELDQEEHVVCIRFNPWRFADENTMLLNFFNDLVRAIDRDLETTGEKLGEVINTYVKPLAQFFGKGENVDAVSNILSSADIDEIKSRVEKILEEEKKRVVVFIDDIDRLEKSEIHAVFRMVKLTADFKYTAYILAFDKEMVSASLQERYGTANSDAGRLFLEKIIQVPLQLPAIEKEDLRTFCFQAIDDALKAGEIILAENDVQQFVNQFQAFESQMKTPRQAMLYSNIIMFSLPILKGEVNMVDLMLIEALRVFNPEIYQMIRENKAIFLHQLQTYNEQQEKERRRKLIDETLMSLDINDVEEVKEVLKYLFPRLESIYSNTHYGHDWNSEWEAHQRICSDKYFQRYFSYSVPRGDLSDIKMNSFLDNLEHKSLEESILDFEDFINEKNVVNFISKMRSKVKSISNNDVLKNLAMVIAIHGNMYPNPQQLFQFSNTFSQAAMLLGEIIMKQDAKGEKMKIAEELINQAKPLHFATEIFSWLRSSKDKEGNKLAEEDLNVLGKVLVDKITMEITNDVNLMFSNFRGALAYWNMYGEKNQAKETVSTILKSNPDYALNLMKQYLPHAWSNGIKVDADLERETYDVLVRDIKVEDLIGAINKVYINLPDDEEYPEFVECTHEEKIVRQFVWLHKHVQSLK